MIDLNQREKNQDNMQLLYKERLVRIYDKNDYR